MSEAANRVLPVASLREFFKDTLHGALCRQHLTVEDQTVQIFAATNGFLDRLRVERVPEFLLELVERMHAQHGELRAKISGGDWSEEVQAQVRKAVEAFAADFGQELDEEGQPIDEETPLPPSTSRDLDAERPQEEQQPEGAAA